MIQQKLIMEAKRYLIYSELPIKNISFQLGFETVSTFSAYFKNKTQVTPKQFRARNKANLK